MNIKLVKLTPAYRPQLEDMMGEWLATEQSFSPYAIRKNDYHDFDRYLSQLERTKEESGRVPDSVFFCLDLDRDIFVGAVNIRHYLNEDLLQCGGHIGDGIRPSERRKGYATAMIRLALEECRKLGIPKVLMTCDKDNVGSAKSIMNNGGVLENEVINEDGVWEQRYWIDLERIPPVTTVYFVRHCQSEFSHRDDRTRPLTALGMEDSAAVAQVLHKTAVDAFYCSPYRRSLDTIAKAAQAHGLPIRTDERLRERQSGEGGNFGLKDDGDTPLRKRWRDFGWCEPGGESLGAVQERNIQALREILSESTGKTLVIGTHGTALSTVLNYYRPSFGCEDFLRIVDWMPYIVRLTFDGQRLLTSEEIFHIDRPYQK